LEPMVPKLLKGQEKKSLSLQGNLWHYGWGTQEDLIRLLPWLPWYHSIHLDEEILHRCQGVGSRPQVGRCPPLSRWLDYNGCFHRVEWWNSKP
jgi:hypothetical protein